MIQLFVGENTFEIERAVQAATAHYSGEVEKIDGDRLELSQLPNLLMGATLFAEQRFIIITGLSAQKELWGQLSTWLPRLSDDTQLILVESSVDRRTKTYKWLQKNAKIVVCDAWNPNQARQAEVWLKKYAAEQNCELNSEVITDMVERAIRSSSDDKPIIDQERLTRAVAQLRHADGAVTTEMLDAVMARPSHENMFVLLARALHGDTDGVQSMIEHVRAHEDGHRAMGLLASQVASLAALVLAGEGRTTEQVASDIGAHPFAVRQLASEARGMSRQQLVAAVEHITRADEQLKRSKAEPWVLIESALVKIAQAQ